VVRAVTAWGVVALRTAYCARPLALVSWCWWCWCCTCTLHTAHIAHACIAIAIAAPRALSHTGTQGLGISDPSADPPKTRGAARGDPGSLFSAPPPCPLRAHMFVRVADGGRWPSRRLEKTRLARNSTQSPDIIPEACTEKCTRCSLICQCRAHCRSFCASQSMSHTSNEQNFPHAHFVCKSSL
jgi:hypothetical protein